MPATGSIEVSSRALAEAIIVLGLNDDPTYKHSALTAGASSYLLKDTVPTHLATTIRDTQTASVETS